MKYQVAFIMTNGHEIRATVSSDGDVIGSESIASALTDNFANTKFFNFVENDKLVIVNMYNVSHIRVCKMEEES